jgi:hypothetical protein
MTASERIATGIKVEQLDLFKQARGLSYVCENDSDFSCWKAGWL